MGARDATVGVIGTGPAAEAVHAAATDIEATLSTIGVDDAGEMDLVVAVAGVGSPVFDRLNRAVERPWIGTELGGIGGRALPAVDAAVTVFGSDGGCFDCLRTRVASNLEEAAEGEGRITRTDARLAGAVAGRVLASAVEDGPSPGRLVELPYAERRLLPVPGCSCDAVSDRTVSRDDEDASLEEAVGRAEQGIDSRIGLVSTVGEVHSFPAPYYLATLCDTAGFADAAAGPQAAGVAVDWNPAYMKAVGEALERYSAGVYRETTFLDAPAPDLPDAVPPSAFVLPDDYPTPDPDESIPWIEGEDLATGEAVHLPAEFVVFPPPAQRHKPAITTGLGLGSSGAGALRSGLSEVVERDATMLAWYSTFEPLELVVGDPGFDTLRKRAAAEDLSTTAMLVTQDVDVPVVSVAVHRDGDWPRFAVGSGADLDPTAAARSALAEAIQNWMELRGMGPDRAAEEATAIGRYADFPPEARSFVDLDGVVEASAIDPGEPVSGTDALSALRERASAGGLSVYAARLTPRDVEALGFEAVRVLSPEAQPLFTDERYFGERARRVPRDLGFRPRLDRPPHPYP